MMMMMINFLLCVNNIIIIHATNLGKCYIALFATPNHFLLKQMCLNQMQYFFNYHATSYTFTRKVGLRTCSGNISFIKKASNQQRFYFAMFSATFLVGNSYQSGLIIKRYLARQPFPELFFAGNEIRISRYQKEHYKCIFMRNICDLFYYT